MQVHLLQSLAEIPVLTLVLLSVAIWRLSHMLVYEIGPGGVLHWIRVHTGITYDEEYNPYPHTWNPLWCVYCTSVTVAAVLTVILVYGGLTGMTIVLLLALSGIVCLIERWHG